MYYSSRFVSFWLACQTVGWHLGAIAGGAKLSAMSYGTEIGATSAPPQSGDKYLSAITHGVETCYLGATICGADP